MKMKNCMEHWMPTLKEEIQKVNWVWRHKKIFIMKLEFCKLISYHFSDTMQLLWREKYRTEGLR